MVPGQLFKTFVHPVCAVFFCRSFCIRVSPLFVRVTGKVCLTQLAETIFIPCGHLVACRECAVTLGVPRAVLVAGFPGLKAIPHENTSCPICRTAATSVSRLFT